MNTELPVLPENALEEEKDAHIKALTDYINKSNENNKLINSKIEETVKRNEELTKQNQRLMLRVTGSLKEEVEEIEIPGFIDEESWNLLSEKQKEQAMELVKGDDE